MPYDDNTPLPNQTVAQTTDPIRNNFKFIQTDFRAEHVFNGSPGGQQEGTHLQASMPNIVDPAALPTGKKGIYYVRSNVPKFYNAAGGAQYIALGPNQFVNTITSWVDVGGGSGTLTLPQNASGMWFIRSDSAWAADSSSAFGMFITTLSSDVIEIVGGGGVGVLTDNFDLTFSYIPPSGKRSGTYFLELMYYLKA